MHDGMTPSHSFSHSVLSVCWCVCAEIILSLNKMNNVISFDPVSGVLVAQVERERGKGLIFEHQHQQEQDDRMPLIYIYIYL